MGVVGSVVSRCAAVHTSFQAAWSHCFGCLGKRTQMYVKGPCGSAVKPHVRKTRFRAVQHGRSRVHDPVGQSLQEALAGWCGRHVEGTEALARRQRAERHFAPPDLELRMEQVACADQHLAAVRIRKTACVKIAGSLCGVETSAT